MKGFSFTILTASLVGGIINSLVSKNSKLKKYVLFIVTLVCTLSIISPISAVLTNVSDFKKSVEDFFESTIIQNKINLSNEIIIKESKERIESGIKDLLIQKYKFDENEVSVEIILDKKQIDNIKIEKIYVYISGKASWSNADEIKKYLENTVGSEFIVKRR